MDGFNPISPEAPVLLTPTEALLRGFELAAVPAAAPPLENEPGGMRGSARASIDGLQARQGFRVGTLNLMIRYADGSELTELPLVHRLPNSPHWLLGMANLHGALVPVFDLARYFGVERPAAAKPMLLVLAHAADAAGVVIDRLPERLRWGSEQLTDSGLVPEALAEVAPRAVLIGDQLWFDLDCTALLAALEQSLGAAL
jgi:twitching motility protein PilI